MEVYYTRCLLEGHPCLVPFDYESDNNCKPKIGGETQVTNKLSSESSMDQIQYRTMCERCSHGLLSSSFGMGMASF